MALDTRRHRRHDTPDANISNKTLPGFALMGVGLLLVIVGAILIPVTGSPPIADLATESEKLASVAVIALGLAVLLVGIVLSIWLKTRKPKESAAHQNENQTQSGYPNPNSNHSHQTQDYDYQHQHQSQHQSHQSHDYPPGHPGRQHQSHEYGTEGEGYGAHPSTVSTGYHQYPMYGPPAPMRKT